MANRGRRPLTVASEALGALGEGGAPSGQVAPGGARAGRPARRTRRFDVLPYALVVPLALFVVGLALVPAAVTVVEAFFRVQPLNPPDAFVGLQNFVRLFHNDAVRSSLTNTALYTVSGVLVTIVLGIVMAVTLQNKFFGRSVLIALLILPWALPGVVEGIIWSGIWDSNTGLLNSLLNSVHLIDHYQVFLGRNRYETIFAIELGQIWQMTPLSALLVLAALQNIPADIYEAASLDGCSPWGSFRRITLPLIRPGIAVAMVQAIIATLNIFDQPYVLNGAASTGASMTLETYLISFQNLDFGEGYALSLFIMVLTIVISFIAVKLVYRPVEF
jgi:multiple sugar transport system permease protein